MSENEHLSPELFVDLLDGAPVDTRWRQHAESCPACRAELREIEQALHIVREPERPLGRSRPGVWMAAAAAVLVAAGVYVVTSSPNGAGFSAGAAVEQEMLPPLEADEDFALLLALSRTFSDESVLDAVDAGAPLGWDPYDLTPSERAALLERLAMESEARPGS